jgi:hypothetical protein
MDTVVFSVVFILVILACFVLAIIAVAAEERRQIRAERVRYAPKPVATITAAPTPPVANVTALAPVADTRSAHFVPAP